ncbi:MAG: hypothetical protein ACREKH_04690, partial [Candidatus Rokuibacteriota bacterium]
MRRAYREHYGREDSDALVWQADTRSMNPTVDEALIRRAYLEDEPRAAAEYGAEFRRDIESFVSTEVVDAAVVPGRYELAPIGGREYLAFTDPSGGSSDSMTLAIAHLERPLEFGGEDKVVLDLVREERPPFRPDDVVRSFVQDVRRYGISTLTGDRFAPAWVGDAFNRYRVAYKVAALPKSEIYREALPLLNAHQVELLDLPRLRAQLLRLERRQARGGRESIDHPAGLHDDVANSALGACWLARPRVRG